MEELFSQIAGGCRLDLGEGGIMHFYNDHDHGHGRHDNY
jgi:hypothetical protein